MIKSLGPSTTQHLLGSRWLPRWTGSYWAIDQEVKQYCPTSYNSVCFTESHPGPPYRTGGPFTVRRYAESLSPGYVTQVRFEQASDNRYYSGGVVPGNFTKGSLPSSASSGLEYGAEAWRKARPGKSGVDLAQAIAELKDLPGMIVGLKNLFKDAADRWPKVIKKGSDGYLQYMFGIAPIVSDLKGVYKTYNNQERILAQLKRDNNRKIRRRRELVDLSTSTTTNMPAIGSNTWPVIYTQCLDEVEISTRTRKVWFEGCFQYYIPDIGTVEWERRAIANLYGSVPTVRLLWELTPWSFLVDYFVNVGDALGNLQDDQIAENLYAHYAYMMDHVRRETVRRATHRALSMDGNRWHQFSCSRQTVHETKSRSVSSKFGFGLTDGLSDRQATIIAALAGSRIPSR